MSQEEKNTPFSEKIRKMFSPVPKNNILVKIAIAAFLTLLISFMYPSGESKEYNYTVGQVWTEKDLVAPFSFPIYKDAREYEQEKEEAGRIAYPVFERHDDVVKDVIGSLDSAVDLLRSTIEERQKNSAIRGQHELPSIALKARGILVTFSEEEWSIITRWYSIEKKGKTKPFLVLRNFAENLFKDLYRAGIIDQIKIRQSPGLFALRKKTAEDIISSQNLYDVDEATTKLWEGIISSFGQYDSLGTVCKLFQLLIRPNLLYNRSETERSVQIAKDNVPRTLGYVQQHELIISSNQRITEESRLKLESLAKVRAEQESVRSVWIQRVGIFFHVAIITGLYTIYLFLFRKRIFHSNALLLLIGIIVLIEALFGYLSLRFYVDEPTQYLIAIPAASMLLAILFDSRVAFYGTVTMAFLIAGIRGNDYSIALASLIAGALGAYTVRDIRHRTQIFRSLVFIFLGYTLVIVAFAFERYTSLEIVTKELTYAFANAVISPVLTYGLLIFFEKIFPVATDLTLQELSNINRPLLNELSEKAPGTFHHSMTIGNMAEAAAEAVGANPILAKVGGYYHDIGKTLKPEYFVENQIGNQNRHTRLKPRMSALIIASHVKEGVELGKQYGLPEKVLDFIPQHHGTTRMSFFFDKALKQAAAKKNPKDDVNEEDFRYPGPKPQSREAGIVMLADSVEASVRSIVEMTPQKLESVIDNMIKQRFIEGQLDECTLTLRDLTNIKEAFLKILMGIHHQRITYPEQEKLEEPASEQPAVITAQEATIPPDTVSLAENNTVPDTNRKEEPPPDIQAVQ